MMRSLTIIAAAAVAVAIAGPVRADDHPSSEELRGQAEEAFREGAEQIVRALELLLRSIPQYESPQIMENGDIVIRRKRWPPPRHERSPPEPGESRT